MDGQMIDIIILVSVLWYVIGVLGSVIGFRRLKAHNNATTGPVAWTYLSLIALLGVINLILVLTARDSYWSEPRTDRQYIKKH